MTGTTYTGPISINSKGVGFFDIDPLSKDRKDSIEIQPENVNKAFHGDTVEIQTTGEKIKNREQGKVLKVITRAKSEFVGTFHKDGDSVYVVPDDKRMYTDIFLVTAEDAKIPEGTKVLVEIDWEKSDKQLIGGVIKIIGQAGENNT